MTLSNSFNLTMLTRHSREPANFLNVKSFSMNREEASKVILYNVVV